MDEAYIKGHYDYNGGCGGSAYAILCNGKVIRSASRGLWLTTSVRAEILAAVSVVSWICDGSEILIHTNNKCLEASLNGKKLKPDDTNADLLGMYYKRISDGHLKVSVQWNAKADNNAFMRHVDDEAMQRLNALLI